jgi:ABC-2 type transport system permease protein
MNARMLRPMIVKEFRQILRDPTALGMLLVLPAALIVMVGYALNFDVRHIPLAILDGDRSAESRALLRTFQQTEYFDHLFTADSYRDIDRLFSNGEVRIAVIIPTSFGKEITAGRSSAVQILVDGADNTTAGQAVLYAVQILATHSANVAAQAMLRKGVEQYVPIDFRPRIWYNPDLVSARFLIPGLIGFIIVLTAIVSTSLTVVREKERGTMEQIMVSPLRPVEIILGKTLPYLAISLVAATLILILGYVLFGISIQGSVLLLYVAILILLFGALGQGLLISTVTNSQQVAFMISVFSSLLPSFLLSGFVFPISSMPVFLQVISNVAVTKFFLVIVRGIVLKGVGVVELWDQFLYLGAFAVVVLGLSIVRMRKRSA